jgi:hypothetical protein
LFEMRVFDFGKCSKRCLASSLSGIQNWPVSKKKKFQNGVLTSFF